MNKGTKQTILTLALCIAAMLFSAQQSERALIIKQLMDEEIERRVEKYKAARAKRCRELILNAASQKADSIVITMAKELRIIQDTVNRPAAPDRPNRPVPLKPIDSTAAAPLLPDTLIMD